MLSEIDPEMKKSMTYDCGVEIAIHRVLTEQTGVKVYFADPSSPCQRETNENTHRLIRQYFPKGTDFSKFSLKEIKFAQDRLNNRPRKVLNWATPLEEFKKINSALKP